MLEFFWTEDRVAKVVEGLKAGLTNSQIAESFTNIVVTKGMIAGVVFRKGLRKELGIAHIAKGGPRKKPKVPSTRKFDGKALKKRPPQFILFGPKPKVLPKPQHIEILSDQEIPLTQRKTFVEMDFSKYCCWPVNDPRKEDFFYCGGDRAGKSVYCESHSRMAYKPSTWTQKSRSRDGSQADGCKRKEDTVAIS